MPFCFGGAADVYWMLLVLAFRFYEETKISEKAGLCFKFWCWCGLAAESGNLCSYCLIGKEGARPMRMLFLFFLCDFCIVTTFFCVGGVGQFPLIFRPHKYLNYTSCWKLSFPLPGNIDVIYQLWGDHSTFACCKVAALKELRIAVISSSIYTSTRLQIQWQRLHSFYGRRWHCVRSPLLESALKTLQQAEVWQDGHSKFAVSFAGWPGWGHQVNQQKFIYAAPRRGKDNSKVWSTPKDLGISTCCDGPFLAQSAKIFETTQPWALALERSEFFVADNRLSTFSWVQLHQHLAEASADFVLIFCTVFLLISRHFLWGSKIFFQYWHTMSYLRRGTMIWYTKSIYFGIAKPCNGGKIIITILLGVLYYASRFAVAVLWQDPNCIICI